MSYSKLNTYLTCSMKYKYKYIDKIEAPKSLSLLFGTVVHNVIRAWNIGNLEPTQVKEATTAIWQEQLNKTNIENALDAIITASMDKSIELLDGYFKLDRPKPDGTELYLTREADGIVLEGYIDGIFKDGNLVDYKTSSYRWKEERAGVELQPSFYALLLDSNDLTFYFDILIKTKTPTYQLLNIHITNSDTTNTLKLVKTITQCIQNKIYYPIHSSIYCNPGFCEYYGTCYCP